MNCYGKRYKLTSRSVTIIIGLLLASLSLGGCGQVSAREMREATANVDKKLVSTGTNAFAFDLYGEQVKKDGQKNLMISPTSIAMALAMTINGAAGETEQAMAKVLHHEGMSLDELNQAYETLRISLTNPDPKVELSIANSIWMHQGVKFEPDFVKRTEKAFAAEVAELDYFSPSSVKRVNDWVSKQTRGKIDKILEKMEGVLTLVNAIYFNGEWSTPFKQEETQERPFHLLDGSEKQHPMMSRTSSFRYYEDPKLQAIRLPYGSGRMAMYVLLPSSESSLVELQDHLDAASWESLLTQMNSRRGTIVLPRFQFEYDDDLKETLEGLGMAMAFDPDRADFSRARKSEAGERLYISKVIHKTMIEVNERGTEAAAATAVVVTPTSAPMNPEQPFKMVVDRPFLFAIRDDHTGAILFLGSVVNPQ